MSNEPSENWDDDFEFRPNDHPRSLNTDPNEHSKHHANHDGTTSSRFMTNPLMHHIYSDDTKHSRVSINLTAWDEPTTVTEARAQQLNLALWSEDTDCKHNYDDDFGPVNDGDDYQRTVTSKETSRSYTAVPPLSFSHQASRASWVSEGVDDGLYDRDIEHNGPQTGSSLSHARSSSAASTSANDYLKKTSSSSSLNIPTHSILRNHSHSPDPLPLATSPTLSTFSSPSNIALSFAASSRPLITPPPVSPPRPRRRLRKKSRPQEFDPNGLNSYTDVGLLSSSRSQTPFSYMDDDDANQRLFDDIPEERMSGTITPLPKSPSPRTPPQAPSPAPAAMAPSSPPIKTPLLSRISSVKRWRSRRSSQTSKDFMGDTSVDSGIGIPFYPPRTPEPSLSRAVTPASPTSAPRNWLFKSGSSPNSKQTTTNSELQRINSNSARPGSRFRKRSSTTAEEVVLEEQADHDLKGKKRSRSSGIVSRVLGVSNHIPDMNLTPKQSRTALRHTADDAPARRPLSLQPQPKSSSHRSASIGRTSSNPFIAGSSKENASSDHSSGGRQSFDLSKKRTPSSNSLRRSGHRRSISLTSDPDEPSYGRAVIPSIPETPPPVPPLPSTVGAATGSSLLPPINLSPPSPSRNIPRPSWNPWAAQSNELLAPSTPPRGAIQALANSSLLHRMIGKKGSAPPSPGQSFSLGRATQHSHSQLLMEVATAQRHGVLGEGSATSLPSSFSSTQLRRSSLGDLKIPPRISLAQTGLRSNLTMIREFANKIDELQRLCNIHVELLGDLKRQDDDTLKVSDSHAWPINSVLHKIEEQYALWWECAELLVELGGTGGGKDQEGNSAPPTLTSTPPALPASSLATMSPAKDQGRTTTLHGVKESTSVIPSSSNSLLSPDAPTWQASAGRHDLSTRQLTLLRDMLETPDPATFNRLHTPVATVFKIGPHPSQASTSAITLPSIPPSPPHAATPSSLASGSSSALAYNAKPDHSQRKGKFHRARKTGLIGIRDMLRLLTNRPPLSTANGPTPHLPSTSSLSSRSEAALGASGRHRHRKRKSADLRNTLSSGAKHDELRLTSPCGDEGSSSLNLKEHHRSPKRPSLASIFRIGQSHASASNGQVPPLVPRRKPKPEGRRRALANASTPDQQNNSTSQLAENTTTEEEEYSDWDRIDSASDLEMAQSLPAAPPQATLKTLRGCGLAPSRAEDPRRDARTPLPTHFITNDSQVSFADRSPLGPSRQTVRPSTPRQDTPDFSLPDGVRAFAAQSPTVRSAPPKIPGLGEEGFRLALTPEKIRPLLEYAKEVGLRVSECVGELKQLRQHGHL